MDAYQVSFIIAIALALFELMTGAFIFLGLSIGVMAVAMIQWITGQMSLNRDLIIVAVIALADCLLFRHFFKKPQDQEAPNKDVNQY